MDILLDTASFLMLIAETDRLSQKARNIFMNDNNRLLLSVVSGWEIIVKNHLGKLPLHDTPVNILTDDVVKHNIESIELTMEDIFELHNLPLIHKDPFDRMLICQARARKIPILTPDPWIRKYDVATIW